MEKIRRAYNDQLLRYNNQYSRLVGNFHTNADAVLKIIQGMPEQRFLMELQSKIYMFTGQQNQFQEHFVNVKKAIAEYTTKFLDLRKEKNLGKNLKLETDTARAKGMYEKIDGHMTKFQKIVVEEDRITTQIKKSTLPQRARDKILNEINENDFHSQEQLLTQKNAYLSGLEKRLNNVVDNSDFLAVSSDSLPVNTIAVGVVVIVIAIASIMLSGQKKKGLPMDSNSAVSYDWSEGTAYNRKEI